MLIYWVDNMLSHDRCDVVVQYPISFALNLAIPTDKVLGVKQVYCASPTSPTTADDSTEVKDTSAKCGEGDVELLKVGVVKWQNYNSNQLMCFLRCSLMIVFCQLLRCYSSAVYDDSFASEWAIGRLNGWTTDCLITIFYFSPCSETAKCTKVILGMQVHLVWWWFCYNSSETIHGKSV